MVKIRLARRGRKRNAIYDIVAADARSPRDGKFIEKLGQYNPNTTPAEITLNTERALHWLMVGGQPTDTTRKILSVKGVMFKKHLQVGVNKGAITQEAADARFDAWLNEKLAQRESRIAALSAGKDAVKQAKAVAERKKKEDMEAAAKKAAADALAALEAANAPAVEETEGETPAEDATTEA